LLVVQFAMTSYYVSIQNIPSMLYYGQNPDDPTGAWPPDCDPAVNKFLGRWSEQPLSRANEVLRAAQEMFKRYAHQAHSDSPIYEPGDKVLLLRCDIKYVSASSIA
jgi:hypothetical protein